MKIISVDPGQKGGIAQIFEKHAQAFVMPNSVHSIVNLLKSLSSQGDWLVVERSQPMPKQGITSAFTYGKHFGIFETIASCIGLKYLTIRPNEWKKAMGLNSEKTCSIIEAERLFPTVQLIPDGCRKPSDGIAEALLIGEYARRMIIGKITQESK